MGDKFVDLVCDYCLMKIEKEEEKYYSIDMNIDLKVDVSTNLKYEICNYLAINKDMYIYDPSEIGIRVRNKIDDEDYVRADFNWNDLVLYDRSKKLYIDLFTRFIFNDIGENHLLIGKQSIDGSMCKFDNYDLHRIKVFRFNVTGG